MSKRNEGDTNVILITSDNSAYTFSVEWPTSHSPSITSSASSVTDGNW
jgi:type IV secretory pathway VirB9-like protein